MDWDADRLKKHVAETIRVIRGNLERIKLEDLPNNPAYWGFYDQELGELHVYLRLDDDAPVQSREAFVARLR